MPWRPTRPSLPMRCPLRTAGLHPEEAYRTPAVASAGRSVPAMRYFRPSEANRPGAGDTFRLGSANPLGGCVDCGPVPPRPRWHVARCSTLAFFAADRRTTAGWWAEEQPYPLLPNRESHFLPLFARPRKLFCPSDRQRMGSFGGNDWPLPARQRLGCGGPGNRILPRQRLVSVARPRPQPKGHKEVRRLGD
jgi:hypothetical protein